MAIDRQIPNSSTPDPIPGDDFMDETQEEITGLWNYASVPFAVTGGTADDITGTLTPPLLDGWKNGMRITFIAPGDNTGAMTINGADLNDGDGNAVSAGRVLDGNIYEAIYIEATSELRLLGAAMPAGFTADDQTFNSSGTWNKPAGLSDNALVLIECWAGGGGGGTGSTAGGGGGGGFVQRFMTGVELSSTETVTIGAGGAVNTQGGNTTFGSHVTAYGGGGGNSGTNSGGGGGGGGSSSKGVNGGSSDGGRGGGPVWGAGGTGGAAGGNAADGAGGGSNTGGAGGGGHFGGGGGGGGATIGSGGAGGNSHFGGGGGGGSAGGAGGVSIRAGNGGAANSAGSVPSGGGGRNAAGAAGRCRVRVIG